MLGKANKSIKIKNFFFSGDGEGVGVVTISTDLYHGCRPVTEGYLIFFVRERSVDVVHVHEIPNNEDEGHKHEGAM